MKMTGPKSMKIFVRCMSAVALSLVILFGTLNKYVQVIYRTLLLLQILILMLNLVLMTEGSLIHTELLMKLHVQWQELLIH